MQISKFISAAAIAGLGMVGPSHASRYYLSVPLQSASDATQNIAVSLAAMNLNPGYVGEAYTYPLSPLLTVTGDPRYSTTHQRWAISEGDIPGIQLNSRNGLLTGVPANTGNTRITVTASYKGKSTSQSYQLSVQSRQSELELPDDLSGMWSAISLTALPDRRVLTLKNIGDAPLTVTIPTLSAPFTVVQNSCESVAPGATCQAVLELGFMTQRSASSVISLAGADKGIKTATLAATATGTYPIVKVGEGRQFFDGSYAATCNGYRTASGMYSYTGATGNGIYTVDPDGPGAQPPFAVYCDMTTDGGGWTLVVNSARNHVETFPLSIGSGISTATLSPLSPVSTPGGFVGFNRWAGNFQFTKSRLSVIAGDNPNQKLTYYKTVTQNNLLSWDTIGGSEPDPSTICRDLAMTQGCRDVRFNHRYQDSDARPEMLMLNGVYASDFGFAAGPDFPVHLTITGSAGLCSVTMDLNDNAWNDSFGDGHWGNGLQVWLK